MFRKVSCRVVSYRIVSYRAGTGNTTTTTTTTHLVGVPLNVLCRQNMSAARIAGTRSRTGTQGGGRRLGRRRSHGLMYCIVLCCVALRECTWYFVQTK
jgi:hypothetical protein